MNDSSDGAAQETPGSIKVIGIGQSLRGDDGAGLAAVRLWVTSYLAKTPHPAVQVELAELPGIALLDLLAGATQVVLVDAVRSGAEPGMLHVLSEDRLDSFRKDSSSAHGWGVAETLSLGRQLSPERLPKALVVIGIEAGQLDLGEGLSPQVQAALPEAARLIEQRVLEFVNNP